MKDSDIGVIGLAVMGENLVLNMESKGFSVSVYNRSADRTTRFISSVAHGKNIRGAYTLAAFVEQLTIPRKVMLMIRAGAPVDELIENLVLLLDRGDVIIDGGNAHFSDTARRTAYVERKGMLYVGTGVSGGEEGALRGPSIMPGGSAAAWPIVGSILQAIAAKAPGGEPCCDWVGTGGAGHFVKMVHNGIEYGDMQLICEAYQLLRDGLGMTSDAMSEIFSEWNQGALGSYLISITRDILAYKDKDGAPLVEKILDEAGQKGTGKQAVNAALESGVTLTLIAEAVFARILSSAKAERARAAKILGGPTGERFSGEKALWVMRIHDALFASKVVSYAQGFALMRAASDVYDWGLDYGRIALLWRGGCIIRSAFLGDIKKAFDQDANLDNLMLDAYFRKILANAQKGWRNVCAEACRIGIPTPAMCAALSYYDGYRSERLPANLLQAQRDYFGAHTYRRVDVPHDESFHTNWTGMGGATSSTEYNV